MTRCSIARRWIASDAIEALAPALQAQLQEHVGSCTACASRLRDARRLTAELSLLRVDAPQLPSVSSRVLARISVAPAPRRAEVGRRELSWIAAGIGAVALAGLATAVAHAPVLLDLLERSGAAASRMRTVFLALASPARGLFESMGGAVLGACAALSTAASRMLAGGPSISSLAWIALLVVLTTTGLVVRRDLRRASGPSSPDKES